MGITVFPELAYTGWMEGGDRVPFGIAMAIVGLIVIVYSVMVHHKTADAASADLDPPANHHVDSDPL